MNIEDLTDRDKERFWSKIDKKGDDDCWNWLGYTNKRSTGFYFATDYSIINIRHIIYYLYYGNTAKGMPIGRRCDNDLCCNPKHLYVKNKDLAKDWNIDDKLTKRFWKKANILDENSCWEWKAGLDSKGYGSFGINYKSIRAPRVAYMILYGKYSIPEGMSVCHACDNRKCVNPSHLFIGSNYDNVQDRHTKGRDGSAKGQNHGRSKLTNENVYYIRESFSNGLKTRKELCDMFSMSIGMIKNIINGNYWKSVGGTITKGSRSKKLVESQVIEIKKLLLDGKLMKKDIAERYNVTPSCINSIDKNVSWKWVLL